MKKLADISMFEGLQNRAHAGFISNMHVFNGDGDIQIPSSVVTELDKMWETRSEPPGQELLGMGPDKWLDKVALDLCIAMTKQLGIWWTADKEKANKVWDALKRAMDFDLKSAMYEDGSSRTYMRDFLMNIKSYVRNWDGRARVKIACGYVDEDDYPLYDEEIEEIEK